jgi:GNAT superfamily N-acetyltransferase
MLAYRRSTPEEWSVAHDWTRANMSHYYDALGRTWDTEMFRDSWPTTENLTLEVEGAAIGFLRLSLSASTVWIRDIQVRPEAQGRGVGTFALRVVQQIALERGTADIRLRVFKINPAIRLYRRNGFEELIDEGATLTMARPAA